MVTLVTKQPYQALEAVAKLYQDEHPNHFRLLVHPKLELHDRWILIDQTKPFGFGGSIKDAGKNAAFTVTPLSPSTQIIQDINEVVNRATPHTI